MKQMSAWSHLPNAKHIDMIIESVKENPDKWAVAWEATRNTEWYAGRSAAWNAAWNAACDAAKSAAWDAAYDAAWSAAWSAAYDAILALIAWENSAKYLSMTYDQVKMQYQLSEDPAALLMMPAVKAFELIKETD